MRRAVDMGNEFRGLPRDIAVHPAVPANYIPGALNQSLCAVAVTDPAGSDNQ